MKIQESYIVLNNLVFYAYHGVNPQEQVVGNEYHIHLKLKVNFLKAAQTDDVEKTVNYAEVFEVIKEEMLKPSKLLENVAWRICEKLFQEFDLIDEIALKLGKRNPPMGADIDGSGVEFQCTR